MPFEVLFRGRKSREAIQARLACLALYRRLDNDDEHLTFAAPPPVFACFRARGRPLLFSFNRQQLDVPTARQQ